MQTYFIVTPDGKSEDLSIEQSVYMEYTVDPNGFLLRHKKAAPHCGGMMGIYLPPSRFCRETGFLSAIISECEKWEYRGILLLGSGIARSDLSSLRRQTEYPVYMPAKYASDAFFAIVDTALSGGNLEEYLSQYQGERSALFLSHSCVDFTLPAESGQCRPLSKEAFQHLLTKYGTPSFYSRSLCARYFTYFADHQAHFVLYDDAQTIREKSAIGEKLHFSAAFLPHDALSQ